MPVTRFRSYHLRPLCTLGSISTANMTSTLPNLESPGQEWPKTTLLYEDLYTVLKQRLRQPSILAVDYTDNVFIVALQNTWLTWQAHHLFKITKSITSRPAKLKQASSMLLRHFERSLQEWRSLRNLQNKIANLLKWSTMFYISQFVVNCKIGFRPPALG